MKAPCMSFDMGTVIRAMLARSGIALLVSEGSDGLSLSCNSRALWNARLKMGLRELVCKVDPVSSRSPTARS